MESQLQNPEFMNNPETFTHVVVKFKDTILECGGSVVECLTWNRRVASRDSPMTLSKNFILCLVLV